MTGTSVILEVRTASGQLLQIRCSEDERDQIREVFEKQVHRVRVPLVGKVHQLDHGGYARFTRYDIEQVRYAGGAVGYIEALRINEPPEGRPGFVIYEHRPLDNRFWEFGSEKGMLTTYENWWGAHPSRRADGTDLIREVRCGSCSPWFYAIGDQEIVADIVAPETGLWADTYYSSHRRFLVRDSAGLFKIMRVLCVHQHDEGRRVTWHDGTFWDEWGPGPAPEPYDEEQPWIEEAMARFRELLAGGRTTFVIPFVDGIKFTGRLSGHENRQSNEGVYKARIRVREEDGSEQLLEGIIEHRCTADLLTVEDTIHFQAKLNKCEVVQIESCVRQLKRGTRGWAGVFTRRVSEEDGT